MKPTSFGMVVRYLLLDRVTYLVLPWAWAAFGFVVDVVIVQLTPAGHTSDRWVGGLAGVFIVVFVLGVQAVARALPFGLAPGVSRRTYSSAPPRSPSPWAPATGSCSRSARPSSGRPAGEG